MKKIYEFKNSLNIGKNGEETIKNYLYSLENVLRVESVQDDKKYQNDDIDFIVYMKNNKKFTVEVKSDTYTSGNLYYETKSCIEFNTLGCLEKTKADFIFYYFINFDTLYIFKTNKFRDWVREEIKSYYSNPSLSKLKKSSVINRLSKNNNKTYTSEGFTIPLKHIENNLLNKKVYKKYVNIA